ncbi:TlpA family protein disulfide reductase [Cupriavidus campinensis]
MTASVPLRRSRVGLWLVVAIVAAAAGAIAGHFVLSPKPMADQAVETFFQTRLADPSGAELDLSRFRGKTLVVNFWAPWCGPCVEEMPELTALHGEYTKRNVEFVGIGIDSASNIQQFLQKVPVAYPLAVAGFAGTELSRSFGNAQGGLPYTVIINPDGTVKYRKMGRVHADELRRELPGA